MTNAPIHFLIRRSRRRIRPGLACHWNVPFATASLFDSFYSCSIHWVDTDHLNHPREEAGDPPFQKKNSQLTYSFTNCSRYIVTEYRWNTLSTAHPAKRERLKHFYVLGVYIRIWQADGFRRNHERASLAFYSFFFSGTGVLLFTPPPPDDTHSMPSTAANIYRFP